MGVTAPRETSYTPILPRCARTATTGTRPPPFPPFFPPVVSGAVGPLSIGPIFGQYLYPAQQSAARTGNHNQRNLERRFGGIAGGRPAGPAGGLLGTAVVGVPSAGEYV